MTATPTTPDAAEPLLRSERHGAVLHLRLNRPLKRNAVNDGLILAIDQAFSGLAVRRALHRAQRRRPAFLRRARPVGAVRAQRLRRRAAFAHVACHAGEGAVRAGAGDRGAARRHHRRRAGDRRRGAHPRGRAQRLLRAARRPARHLRRRRRLDAAAAADRHFAHGRHDAHRPRLRRRRRPAGRPEQLSGRPKAKAWPRAWRWRTRSAATRRCPTSR